MKKYVITFYKFVQLHDCNILRDTLHDWCLSLNLNGTILIAKEGINATLSGNSLDINKFIDLLKAKADFSDLYVRFSDTKREPFRKLKVKVKNEIVTMGVDNIHPDVTTGIPVDPEEWNSIINNDDFIVIDVRNNYETGIGNFCNSTDPDTETFGEFPEYVKNNLHLFKNKKVAMYCTGGIRCEKASSYMIDAGINEVYQLKGGIISYLQQVKPEDSTWQGECFVFDHRISSAHNMVDGDYTMCYSCRSAILPEDYKSDKFEYGVSCKHCYDSLTKKKKARMRERQRQIDLLKNKNNPTALNKTYKNSIYCRALTE